MACCFEEIINQLIFVAMKSNVYFVSGIDTDAGKSYATGYLAREWRSKGIYCDTEVHTDRKYGYVRGYRTSPQDNGMRSPS